MRILQLAKYCPPDHGGIETMVEVLSEGLVLEGFEVEVICVGRRRCSKIQSINGVQINRLSSIGSLFSQPLFFGARKALEAAVSRANLIHLHLPHPLMEWQLLSVKPEIPLVSTYHSDVVRQKALAPFYRQISNKILQKSKLIIPTSYEYFQTSPNLKSYENKCSVIPIGIPPSRMLLSSEGIMMRNRLREKYGAFALFVGRIVSYKGLRFLIEAMKSVDMNLVVVGDGPLKR